jgi:hypothetical protein
VATEATQREAQRQLEREHEDEQSEHRRGRAEALGPEAEARADVEEAAQHHRLDEHGGGRHEHGEHEDRGEAREAAAALRALQYAQELGKGGPRRVSEGGDEVRGEAGAGQSGRVAMVARSVGTQAADPHEHGALKQHLARIGERRGAEEADRDQLVQGLVVELAGVAEELREHTAGLGAAAEPARGDQRGDHAHGRVEAGDRAPAGAGQRLGDPRLGLAGHAEVAQTATQRREEVVAAGPLAKSVGGHRLAVHEDPAQERGLAHEGAAAARVHELHPAGARAPQDHEVGHAAGREGDDERRHGRGLG